MIYRENSMPHIPVWNGRGRQLNSRIRYGSEKQAQRWHLLVRQKMLGRRQWLMLSLIIDG